MGEENRVSIDKEFEKLKEVRFITYITYPAWMANMVLVKKALWKWRMCIGYTNLKLVRSRYPYLLPNNDRMINGSLGYKTSSFMDAYSEYNQIKMNPLD